MRLRVTMTTIMLIGISALSVGAPADAPTDPTGASGATDPAPNDREN